MTLTYRSFDGTPIHAWSVLPTSAAPRAKVILVHGFGTHSESIHFQFLRDHLTRAGVAVYGLDLRGFGRSGGRRAFVHDWQDFLEDLRLFVQAVERSGPPLNLFLSGVSLGGLIAVNYALHSPQGIAGVIALSPALEASGVPAWRRMLARGLASAFPTMALKTGLDGTRLTRDQDAQRAFLSDPFLQSAITLRLASQTLVAMAETAALLPRLELPLLVLHGLEDVIVPPTSAMRVHQLAGSADKELLLFEGALHVLSMETNREQVFDCISSWISNRSERRAIRESDSDRAVPAPSLPI